MVKAGVMKSSNHFINSRRKDAARRTRLLAAFDRSGVSAAAFAREHKINYTTFCGWRQRRDKARALPGFVQIELPSAAAPVELTIELGAQSRLRINSADQIALAARLIQTLKSPSAC
jgi:hypothetical protein